MTSPDAHPLEAVAAAAAAAASANADKSVRLVCLARQLGAVIGVKGAMIKYVVWIISPRKLSVFLLKPLSYDKALIVFRPSAKISIKG